MDWQPGTILKLPSGNRLKLVSLADGEWLCEYMPGSFSRGAVYFTDAFLRRCAKPA